MKLGRLVGWGYLVALAASTGVRWRNPLVAEPDADEKVVTVAAPAGGTPVRIAYRDLGPAAPDGLPVILIHGSPGDNGEVARIARALVEVAARRERLEERLMVPPVADQVLEEHRI